MGTCQGTCGYELLESESTGANCVETKCSSIADYSTLCKHCILDEIVCQLANCSVACAAYLYSDGCATCTNSLCRPQFSSCSGLAGANPAAGGGTGGADAPPPATNLNYALIGGAIGGALGGAFLTMAAGVFALRKYRERNVSKEMANAYERKIFGRNLDDAGDGAAAGAVSATLVEDAGGHLSSKNPSYAGDDAASAAASKAVGKTLAGRRLRTRFSFHGTEADEVDVPAGEVLTAIDGNELWTVVRVDLTGQVGVIPNTYVTMVV